MTNIPRNALFGDMGSSDAIAGGFHARRVIAAASLCRTLVSPTKTLVPKVVSLFQVHQIIAEGTRISISAAFHFCQFPC